MVLAFRIVYISLLNVFSTSYNSGIVVHVFILLCSPNLEMEIYTETSPDEVNLIQPAIAAVLTGPVNSGHLADEWHPEDDSLVVQDAYIQLGT